LTILPLSPVPLTWPRSTPLSIASFLAKGEIKILLPEPFKSFALLVSSFCKLGVFNVSVTFSENTVVTGTPQITMETGTADGTGNFTSGSGTTVLSFDYIVASGHHSADLDYENTSA
jgi:hypothetical protein